jgi:hypothetical protein
MQESNETVSCQNVKPDAKDIEARRQELKALAAKLNVKTGSTKRGSVADYHY